MDAFRLKPDQDFITDDNGWSGAAVIRLHEFADDAETGADVALFEFVSSRREEALHRIAGRSAGLGEDDDLLPVGHYSAKADSLGEVRSTRSTT